MSIILWVIFGAVVGFIADYLDNSVRLSWPEKIIVGIIGALVGGTIYALVTTGTFDITASNDFDVISVIVAVLGALLTLFIYKRVRH